MAKMIQITCKCGCGRKKMVRVADRNRGWGLFYSKSCKAKFQERFTGQYRAYLQGNGVSHAAKRRGEEDPIKAVKKYVAKNNNFYRWPTKDEFGEYSDGILDEYEDEIGWDAHKDVF